jgi:1-pyrroline-5-carboxylate dehydrogenase
MAIEVGKTRLEALGEVEEGADLIRYYSKTAQDNAFYEHPMDNLGDAAVHTRSILRPHGVFAVISPFNFPMALAVGPTSAAMLAGNTVVFKPASASAMTAIAIKEVYRDAGVPDGVFNLVMGPGDTVGDELQTNPGIDGIVFTGSYEVGFELFRSFSTRYPRPSIVEMGGKNPAIVTATADLDEAAEGVMRGAFGFSGQKCSANSRVYVERAVYDQFVELLGQKAAAISVGDPVERQNWMGPVINQRAMARYENAVSEAKHDGRVVAGGTRLTDGDLGDGYFVAPTVVADLPLEHRLFKEELFLPFVAIAPVDSVDQALDLANDNDLGLTAGIYTGDQADIDKFLGRIEAGVVYVNRRAGSTTGAWPGVQPFGGWKGSTATGKAGGGLYYVQQFMREQSQTVVD